MNVTKKDILEYMNRPDYEPVILKDLYKHFGVSNKKDRREFRERISELLSEEKIFKNARHRYTTEKAKQLTGRLEFIRSGKMAFIKANDGKEYVVFPEVAKDAMHRDIVAIKPEGYYKEWRRARVTKVVKRNLTRVVGILVKEGKRYYIVPDDKRVGYRFAVIVKNKKNDLKGAEQGDKVYGNIVAYPGRKTPPKVRIVRVLGDVDDPRVHLPSVILKHGLPFPEEFPSSVLKQTEDVPSKVFRKKGEKRKDFRNELIFTIDGESAKDFDDAVSIRKLKNGNFKLGVHIADVANYVRPGTPIDNEAFERATSVYLIDTVVPMLPVKLSNGICSLQQNRNRLTTSLEMEIDKNGKVVDFEPSKGIIRSRRRLTYKIVNRYLMEGDSGAKNRLGKTKGLLTALETMQELARVLKENRKQRGAIIGIESGEAEIILDKTGHTKDIVPRKRGIGESMIEEFMIKANEVVASIFEDADLPFLYRIHENPDAETLQQLKNYIVALGIEKEMPRQLDPIAIQKLLESMKNHPLKNSVERLVVRTMKRAIYDESNVGHYGLASTAYTHFTSPIRRYPDLVVHRLLKEYLDARVFSDQRLKYWESRLPEIAKHCSQKERVANESEWDLIGLKKVDYVAQNQSEVFEVVVTNVGKFGIFVEVKEKMIPGLIHISTLNDFFVYDESKNMLIGERTKKVYKLGDILKVRVKNIDYVRGEVDFEIV